MCAPAFVLFGSAAAGTLHEERDIDLIVVGDFAERFHKRTAALLALTDLPVERLIDEQNPFILPALSISVTAAGPGV